jgi:uncharacterized protein (DUF1800 family)
MVSKMSRMSLRILTALIAVCALSLWVSAQDDPDPNSPTPVLLTEQGSTRALAGPTKGFQIATMTQPTGQAFAPDSRVVLFVRNVSLMKGEEANAFRLYVQDSRGHQYRFPVLGLEPVPDTKGIYALTVQLTDEIGYWEQPTPDGDLAIAVTWRGLMSNFAKLGLGQIGGGIGELPVAAPAAPVGSVTMKPGKGRMLPSISPDYVGYRWSGDRSRFMEQATFGPEANLDTRIRRIGLKSWLAEQFQASYPSAANPYPNQPLKPGSAPADCDNEQTITPDVPVTCFRDTYSQYQPQTWFFREAFYGDNQLRHRVSWALAQIWVTSGVDIQQGRHIVEYHKIISRNAFGNYRTLMKEMTLSPTMGDYLSMAQSTKNNPNENYAREIMQLFTVGLFMLNQDGTLQLDGSNNPIPTYDQNVVNNLTRVLTGWTFCNAGCPNSVAGSVNFIDPMVLVTGNHDTAAKTLLAYPGSTTTNIAACSNCTNATNITTYANASMDQALDNIFNHPSLGPYVGKILIQQLVTSDPTPAYVSRVAGVFNDNGFGVRGDLKAVVRAILLDPEARGDVKTDPNFGKLREPVQFATNILRSFGVRSANGLAQSDGYLTGRGEFNGMAQVPFLSPTVFNFYPPSYVIPGTSLLGPEFAVLNTGTSIQRTNFVNLMAFTAIPIVVSTNAPNGTSLDFSDLQALSTADATGNLLVDELNRRLLHSTMSATMKTTILTAVTSVSSADSLGRVRQAIYLVATSSQYQVQR